ncbi:malonyl CoA-acyl carrier protein transacylase-like isoform X2 [Bradysia coprophila]|uniref:malonyl CoA-acyl carrier protein transacylase-like isoform X2 n=1 Tax=Bradysia coprophila TaxID=38358 RepID=UPI00187DA58D|nr:malonyl CoA-acyl carrier protein transacylase-like isoform X2 [Bradysia coprophila]
MTADSSAGKVFDYAEFLPKTRFIDANTVGYESVKNETKVKLFSLSAPSSSLLAEKIATYSKNPLTEAANDLSDTSNVFRHAVLYSDENNLMDALSTSPKTFDAIKAPPPKLCFIVTCQGTQYMGMGKNVYEWSPVFRYHFDECDAIIKGISGISVKELMHSDQDNWIESPLEALPYTLSLQYALSRLYESWGIKPDFVLGLSFGEYGAAIISGMISLEDGIKMIMNRAKLVIDNIEEEAFGVVEINASKFETAMEQLKKEDGMEDAWLEIAGCNSPLQTCVVGHRKTVHKFVEICKGTGVRCMLMDPYHPYHSRLCAPVIPQFEKITSQVQYNKATNGKFISTVRNGRVLETLDKDYYLEHLQGPALFMNAIATVVKDEGVTHFLEVGPHPINIQMVKDILQNEYPELGTNFEFYSSLLRKGRDRTTLLNTLGRLYTAGCGVNWDNINKLMD